jgi:quinol monooxygenase YgiN
MVIVIVKGIVKAKFKHVFVNRIRDLSDIVRKEHGCKNYDLYFNDINACELFLFELWDSKESLLKHLETEHMNEYFLESHDWFESITMDTYDSSLIQLNKLAF